MRLTIRRVRALAGHQSDATAPLRAVQGSARREVSWVPPRARRGSACGDRQRCREVPASGSLTGAVLTKCNLALPTTAGSWLSGLVGPEAPRVPLGVTDGELAVAVVLVDELHDDLAASCLGFGVGRIGVLAGDVDDDRDLGELRLEAPNMIRSSPQRISACSIVPSLPSWTETDSKSPGAAIRGQREDRRSGVWGRASCQRACQAANGMSWTNGNSPGGQPTNSWKLRLVA